MKFIPIRFFNMIFWALILLAFIWIYFYDYPHLHGNEDEGFDVMKPFLLEKGYSLYTEIWNDQPPVFTYLLWGWFKIFGFSFPIAKFLVTCFSVLLLFTLFQIVKKINGIHGAYFAMGCLIISPHFIEMAGSVYIGLPALTFLVQAFYCGLQYSLQKKRLTFFISLTLFLLACGTKLMVILGFPILILFYLFPQKMPSKDRFINLGFILFSLCIVFCFFFSFLEQ